MKKVVIFFLGLFPLLATAQVDRSKAPKPGPAPQIKIGQPATFTLPNGLKVFVCKTASCQGWLLHCRSIWMAL
jgi:predicted pyridoxine 5'-phosphate oxidase superfamily flavin-nucleotide-binding protein